MRRRRPGKSKKRNKKEKERNASPATIGRRGEVGKDHWAVWGKWGSSQNGHREEADYVAYCLGVEGGEHSANLNVTRDDGHGAGGSPRPREGGRKTICRDNSKLSPCLIVQEVFSGQSLC